MHRMSLAEMVVPYASPEWPHPRKFAFDVGFVLPPVFRRERDLTSSRREYGLGMMANSLSLGCDCLGAIHYLDATMSGHDGEPTILRKCICIHEEDDGLLWKVRSCLTIAGVDADDLLRSTRISGLEDARTLFAVASL